MPRYIVPDTSVIAAGLFREPYSPNSAPLLDAIRYHIVDAIVPELGLSEFLNVCRKKLIPRPGSPAVALSDVEAALQEFRSLDVFWIRMQPLDENAWISHRDHGVETGDAYFLEAARQWDAELWTIDDDFSKTAGAIYGKVYNLKTTAF